MRLALSAVVAFTTVLTAGTVSLGAPKALPSPKLSTPPASIQALFASEFPDAAKGTFAAQSASLAASLRRSRIETVLSTHFDAPVDECFDGVGQPYPAVADGECPTGSPKRNQAYAWGMTATANQVWFGTGANIQCLVEGRYLNMTDPNVSSDQVCEFGQSQPALHAGIPAELGDMRPPHIYVYDSKTGTTELTSSISGPGIAILHQTIGLRAAGNLNGNIVYLAGPALGGISIFAFNGRTKAYLGATLISGYNNIRSFEVLNNKLYAGVSLSSGGGQVWRLDARLRSLFGYTVVGRVDGEAAELKAFGGRLYVGTWPNTPSSVASVFKSTGFSPGDSGSGDSSFQKVWSASSYEPDPVTAKTYGVGAMQVYRGRLYWGTMHVPLSALLAKWNAYGAPSDESDAFVDVLGTWRATSIFSLTGRGQAQLEFGQRYFAVWNPSSEGIYLNWNIVPGAMGAPKIGLSGFGNPFNNYSWSMAVARDQLFVGTMDWSYLANGIVSAPATGVAISPSQAGVSAPDWQFGADLWALGGGRQLTATAINVSGLDTELNYGIRTMALMGGRLYMGTANPMNLNPAGGFRLDSLRFVKVIYR